MRPAAAEVPVLRQWRGQVKVSTPDQPAFAVDQRTLAKVWADLKIAEKRPEIDFGKQTLLVAMVRSSVVQMHPKVDEAGNLSRNVVATPDQPDFKTYVLALISRAGVKTIDGQALGD